MCEFRSRYRPVTGPGGQQGRATYDERYHEGSSGKKGWDRSGGLQTVAWWQNTEKAELSLADTLQYLTEVDKGEVLCMRQCALRTLVGMCTILSAATGSLIAPRLSVSTS